MSVVAATASACLGVSQEIAGPPAAPGGIVVATVPPDLPTPDPNLSAVAPGESVTDTVAADPDWDTLYISRGMMDNFPCHMMGGGLMGACTDAEIAEIVAGGDLLAVDATRAPGTPCRLDDRTIVGDCTDDDIDRITSATIIVVDPGLDAAAPCRVDGNKILGACPPDEVGRLRDEIRAARE